MKTSNKLILGYVAFILTGTMAFMFYFGHFSFSKMKSINGSGNVVERSFAFSGFKAIDIKSNLIVKLENGPYAITLRCDDNLLDLVQMEQHGEVLKIWNKKGQAFAPSRPIELVIRMPEMNGIQTFGQTTIISTTAFAGDQLDIKMDGASEMTLDVEYEQVGIELNGAGKLELKGKAKTLNLNGTGAVEFIGESMFCDQVKVVLTGASSASVNAQSDLDAKANGASTIRYSGNPAKLKTNTTGASNIKQDRDMG